MLCLSFCTLSHSCDVCTGLCGIMHNYSDVARQHLHAPQHRVKLSVLISRLASHLRLEHCTQNPRNTAIKPFRPLPKTAAAHYRAKAWPNQPPSPASQATTPHPTSTKPPSLPTTLRPLYKPPTPLPPQAPRPAPKTNPLPSSPAAACSPAQPANVSPDKARVLKYEVRLSGIGLMGLERDIESAEGRRGRGWRRGLQG